MFIVTASHAKHPGFDSRCPHNRRDCMVAQSCNPATGGQGTVIGIKLIIHVCITWLSLKWLAAALVLEAEWSRVCEIPLFLNTWNCGILFTTLWTERLPMQKGCHFKAHQGGMKGALVRLFPACYKWKHSGYKCWVSKCAHKFIVHTVQKVDRGKGKLVCEQPCPLQKYGYIVVSA